MYLLGQFTGRASIIKFQKNNMAVDWKLEIKSANGETDPFSEMNEIYSYIQPKSSNDIFACGYKWNDPTSE